MESAGAGPRLRLATGGLILAAAFLCFAKLTYPDLQMWDEADNVGVLLESLDAGRPLELRRFGEPYFDKPHLWYYLTQGLIVVLGRDELAFRLVSATAGFCLILLVVLLARRLFSPLAGLAAGLFMLAVRQQFVFRPAGLFSTHNLRSADSDALMILFLFAAFASLALRARGWRPGLVLAALLTGLGLLAKGPLALMPALGFGLYQAVSPSRVPIGRRELAWAVATLFVAAVPWHAAMLWRSGDDFVEKYLAYVAERVTSGLPTHSPGPLYYARILTTRRSFFGAELAVLAVGAVLLARRRFWRFERAGALLSLGLIAAVLQVSKTKIAWYVLPLYPFLALAVAGLVSELEGVARSRDRRRARVAVAGLVAVAAVTAPFAAHNAHTIATLARGPVQVFFSGLAPRCGDDLVYADARSDVHVEFFLRRYELRRGPAGGAACTVTRVDTALPVGFAASHREVRRGGGFVLWARRG
jgi:4-amino-4-deoxy-L-arabinose transferase-like glycosyltransferase